MKNVKLDLPEEQVVSLVRQLSEEGKEAVLRALIPRQAAWDEHVAFGTARMREVCAERGLDWDAMDEAEREQLIDDLVHEV